MWLRYAAVFPLAVALGCAWVAWRHVLIRRQVARWPLAQARVVKSAVEERRFTAASRCTYGAKVIYEFRVAKQTFRSDSLSPVGPVFTSSQPRAQLEAARYPVGAKLSVRYDPANPQRSFLATHDGALGISMWALAALAFTGAAGLIWQSL